jgi:DNA-binding MarR family transcriptional regulator
LGKKATQTQSSRSGADDSLLESFVGYNLRRAAARQRERFRHVFGPYDIRPSQLAILILIKTNSSLRQSQLGKLLDMKRANVVTLLDELQGRCLVERRPATGDRRSYELHLTAKGDRLASRLLALHAKLESDLAHSLGGDELKSLVRLLREFRTVEPEPELE